MFRFWLEFPALLILLFLLLLFSITGAVIHWLQCYSPLRQRIQACALVAPYFASIAILFALYVGFLLANVVSQKNRAFQAVQRESSALLTLNVLSEVAANNTAAIRGVIGAYARSVVTDEWPQMVKEHSSPETERALVALIRAVGNRAIGDEAGSAVQGQMLTLAQKVADTRAERIAMVTGHAQRFAWSALFLLGILTQLALGMVHLDRAQANAVAIAIYTLSAVIALWLIAIQENPFRGPVPVSPAPIERVAAAAAV